MNDNNESHIEKSLHDAHMRICALENVLALLVVALNRNNIMPASDLIADIGGAQLDATLLNSDGSYIVALRKLRHNIDDIVTFNTKTPDKKI